MPTDRTSRTTFLVSILVHTLLVAPVWTNLGIFASDPAPVPERREPLTFHFIDPQDAPEETPQEPTPFVSTADNRAAQPDAPSDLPQGAAFQSGETPIPTVPRQPGLPDPGSQPASMSETQRRATQRPAEPRETDPSGAADQRLALPRNPIELEPGRPSDPGTDTRLPAPRVDQRLARAAAGSTFSLNTTAWDYAPYMARLKRKIEEHIFPPPAFYYGSAAWISRVRFRIAPDGRLIAMVLLDHRGVENLQYVATAAIEGAADYEPLPPGFPEPYLEITGNFYFNVIPPRQ